MSTFLADKPWWAGYLIAAVLILLGLALVTVIYRALRGNRIRTSSNRGRQQRLGVVDTHDIGAERQLIIVRRDNVEHLIMIGGPNDVVIEPAIVRIDMRGDARREREPGAPAWASGETPPTIETGRPPAPEAVAPPEPPPQEPLAPPPAPTRGPRLPDLFARGRRPDASEPPAAAKPAEPKPTEAKPAERKPAEPKPAEPKPVEPKPVEPKPVEPKPVEPKREEPQAAAPAPVAIRPPEAKAAEPKVPEAKTPKAKPAEQKPAGKPPEVKPAEV
ncbi:MAG: flagellar biosynthetic protein FliO, partial [Rhodoblastus sp.]|nr:flagellar biosynthetic protein FliO [Rhodoblastus sp.]